MGSLINACRAERLEGVSFELLVVAGEALSVREKLMSLEELSECRACRTCIEIETKW